MKKSIKSICFSLFVIGGGAFLSGCATMFSTQTTPVVLMNSSEAISVTENGSDLRIENVMAHGTASNKYSSIEYYAPGVLLDKKVKHHTLTIESGGKTGTVDVKLKAGVNWIILDTFTGGIIGWGVDGVTKKWRVADDKYIDVDAVVNNTKPMRQGQLKRMMKKEAKG